MACLGLSLLVVSFLDSPALAQMAHGHVDLTHDGLTDCQTAASLMLDLTQSGLHSNIQKKIWTLALLLVLLKP